MRKIFSLIIVINVVLVAKTPGDSLLQKATNQMNAKYSKGTLTQIIETTSGEERTLEYEYYSSNQGKNILMRYIKPYRVRDNAILMKNHSKDLWMYNSRTGRVRKLASHTKRQNFEGSDFTYTDMGGGGNWEKDYNAEKIGNEELRGFKCNVLECIPKKDVNVLYSKLKIWIRNTDFYPVKVNYYNESGELKKTLHLKNIEKVEGVSTARKYIMENHLENTRTILKYNQITYNIELDKGFFTERNLKQ